jgi:WD40-like Beta Propeller Repeat
MKLRKLTILLLLIAAQLHASAQSADLASAQNNLNYSPARAAERFTPEVQETSADTTKKGANQASKKNTEGSKNSTTASYKTTSDKSKSSTDKSKSSTDKSKSSTDKSKSSTDKSKSTTDKSKSSTDKSKSTADKSNKATMPAKIDLDSAKKTTTVAVKSDNNSTPKPITVSVKSTVETTKKADNMPAPNAEDSTKKIVNASPKVGADSPKKPTTATAESTKKATTETSKNQTKDAVKDNKTAPSVAKAETPKNQTKDAVKDNKTAAVAKVETPKTPTKEAVKDNKTTPSVSATKNNSNAVNETATVRNASILNGDKDDFSPTFFENGLLYCSNSKKFAKNVDKSTIIDDLNLKFAVLDSLGNLTRPSAFSRKTNSKTHEGPSCFSSQGDTMFLTRVMSKGGVAKYTRDGTTTLKIYIKVRDAEGNYVGEAVLPFESENFSYCHPTLSADGQRLYFSSNMPGGFGGMDMWMSRKMKTGEWSKAMNMGSRINTAGNELFPHYAKNGMMYFSSNGRKETKGRTDLDIFRVDVENKIAQPTAMPEGFNTEGDDFGIMFLPTNTRKGYFSSNRKGGSGGDDIYEFEIK